MFQSTYRLLHLFSLAGEVRGRKKLQKMVHLFTVHGVDFPYPFVYHHYGPYSAPLQEEVHSLVEQGLLRERLEEETYCYQLTEKGLSFKRSLEEEGGYHFLLDASLLQSLNKESAPFLEMVSTYAYLLGSGYEKSRALEKAAELKPHLASFLDEAVRFYEGKIKISTILDEM